MDLQQTDIAAEEVHPLAPMQADNEISHEQGGLQIQAKYYRVRRRWIPFITLLLLCSVLGITRAVDFNSSYGVAILIELTAAIMILANAFMVLMRPKNDPFIELCNNATPADIGTLMDAKDMLVGRIREPATEALIRLLPQITPDIGIELNPYHRKCLRQIASPPQIAIMLAAGGVTRKEKQVIETNQHLAVAAIQALEIVGTWQDVRAIEELATGHSLAKSNEDIRMAAQRCLPILKARADSEKPRSIYLRPSTPTVELLRPALGPDTTDSETLLRPAENDQASG